MSTSAFHTVLAHEGLLAVEGADAAKFLQGQLTCNLDYLDAAHSSLGSRCTPKGRMVSSFRILPFGEGYLLALAAELVATQLADLQKYAVFSKVRLRDASAEWQRFGLQAADEQLPLPADLIPGPEAGDTRRAGDRLSIRISAQRVELWVPAGQPVDLGDLPQAPLEAWLLGQVRAGLGQVFGATRELFIPQMINLQAVGGVSFRKGCYAGQEIVARMQYLGRLKRRMYRLATDATVPAPGTELFSPVHASSVGEVVLAAPAGDRCELLAVVQEDAIEDGRLFLGSADGAPLERLELPYTLDRDREIQR